MSVVSSDDAPEPLPSPLPLSSRFLTHWPATCSLFLLPITRSSVFCASCYMSMSLVIKNALWLSRVLVYWIKENPNIIVINTNNITIHVWNYTIDNVTAGFFCCWNVGKSSEGVVNWDKQVVGLGSDGAQVMRGWHIGVGVWLKGWQPVLVHIHCAAHCVALATKGVHLWQTMSATDFQALHGLWWQDTSSEGDVWCFGPVTIAVSETSYLHPVA